MPRYEPRLVDTRSAPWIPFPDEEVPLPRKSRLFIAYSLLDLFLPRATITAAISESRNHSLALDEKLISQIIHHDPIRVFITARIKYDRIIKERQERDLISYNVFIWYF